MKQPGAANFFASTMLREDLLLLAHPTIRCRSSAIASLPLKPQTLLTSSSSQYWMAN